MRVIKVEAEMKPGQPIMLPEGKVFEKTNLNPDGTPKIRPDGSIDVEIYNGLATKVPTGRYILTYENGTTEIVDQERAEQERRALLGSFAAAQAEAIRPAQQGA